jgi:hypothetical protein
MRRSLAGPALLLLVAVVLAACAGSASGSSPPGSLSLATSGPLATLPQVDREFPADHTIEITLATQSIHDREGAVLRELALRPGDEYLFRVTNDNAAPVDHNFYIGAPVDLQERRSERLTGTPVFSGGTTEFVFTVPDDPTGLQFACTLLGHYDDMHGDITAAP